MAGPDGWAILEASDMTAGGGVVLTSAAGASPAFGREARPRSRVDSPHNFGAALLAYAYLLAPRRKWQMLQHRVSFPKSAVSVSTHTIAGKARRKRHAAPVPSPVASDEQKRYGKSIAEPGR